MTVLLMVVVHSLKDNDSFFLFTQLRNHRLNSNGEIFVWHDQIIMLIIIEDMPSEEFILLLSIVMSVGKELEKFERIFHISHHGSWCFNIVNGFIGVGWEVIVLEDIRL